MNTRRLFFGLLLSSDDGERLLDAVRASVRDAEPAPDLRMPRPNGLHLTLHFLGDTRENAIEPLWSAVAQRTADLPAPRFTLAGPGAFPSPEQPRVLWMGVTEDPGTEGRLTRLREGLLAALEEAGDELAWDRAQSFVPHVTVARPRGATGALEGFHALDVALTWRPRSLYLVESRRTPGGPPRYVPLQGATLSE